MGLFRFISGLTGGSYSFIAHNLSYIYFYIDKHYSEKVDDMGEMLFIAGLLNSGVYLEKKQLSVNEILYSVKFASEGNCGVVPVIVHHTDDVISHGNNFLLNYIIQMEVLYFSCDSNVPMQYIIKSVITSKRKIEKSIESTKLDVKYGKVNYPKINAEIERWFKVQSNEK